MKRTIGGLFLALVVLALSSGSLWAQATAQISGTVKDQSGAVLPGVEVTATQTDTGIVRMAVSNETGSYVLANLPTGPYKLEAALPGFRTFVQTGIVLQVNSNPVLNPVLEVGQVTEQVEVQAKYHGYIERQQDEIARLARHEENKLPASLDYRSIRGLSFEVQQKLSEVRPETLGQAMRVPGVTPAAISLLLVHLRRELSLYDEVL